MTKEEFAALLTGREYGKEITREEEAKAKAAGLLVLFGDSDDNVELRGVTHDEVGAYDGATLRILPDGRLLGDFDSLCDDHDEDTLRKHFRDEARGWHKVEALWCAEDDGTSWTFKTDLPHATFDVMEDGEVFGRGIVLALADFGAVPLTMAEA